MFVKKNSQFSCIELGKEMESSFSWLLIHHMAYDNTKETISVIS